MASRHRVLVRANHGIISPPICCVPPTSRALTIVRSRHLMEAGSILTATYHLLRDGTLNQDLGPSHFDRRATTHKMYAACPSVYAISATRPNRTRSRLGPNPS